MNSKIKTDADIQGKITARLLSV